MLLSFEWTMSQVTHFHYVKFLSWKSGGVKKSDKCHVWNDRDHVVGFTTQSRGSWAIEFTTYMPICALIYILSHDDKWRLHSVEYFLQCGFHGANFLYRRTQGFIASCRFSRRRWDEKVLLSPALKFKHRKNCECCPGQSLSLSH